MNSAEAIHLITEAIGKEACQALVFYLDDFKSDKLESMRLEWLAEFADVRREIVEQGAELRAEMAEQGTQLRAEMAEQGKQLRAEIAHVDTKVDTLSTRVDTLSTKVDELQTEMRTSIAGLRTEIHRTSKDQIKWFFATNAALAGLVIAGLRIL